MQGDARETQDARSGHQKLRMSEDPPQMDWRDEAPSSSPASSVCDESFICAGCALHITDRHFLKVNGLTWHVKCLECSVCGTLLHGHNSCYIKNQEIFCKSDYNSTFGTKCDWCGHHLSAEDWVRRARSYTYHLACFSCFFCKRQLSTGEEFGLVDSRVLCRAHYDVLVHTVIEEHDGTSLEGMLNSDCLSKPGKRARTSFTPEQLQVMQTQFSEDSNPDAQTLQKIADMMGLSRRVVQVWFQNCRARHKKRLFSEGMLDELQTSSLSREARSDFTTMPQYTNNECFPLTAAQTLAMMVPHSPANYYHNNDE